MIIANVTAANGQVSAIKATGWSPIKRQIMEAAALKEGMTITYTTR